MHLQIPLPTSRQAFVTMKSASCTRRIVCEKSDVRAKTTMSGHDYFISSPAALSDVILVLRDHLPPGEGRPLLNREGGFWELRDGYLDHK